MPRLLGGIFFALIARYLGVEQVGIYVLASYFIMLANPLVNMGLTQVSMRDISTNQETLRYHFLDFIALRTFSAAVGAVLVQLVVCLLHYPPATRQFLLLSTLAILPVGIARLLQDFFVALEINQYNLVIEFAINALNLMVGTWLLVTGYGLYSLAFLSIGMGLARLGFSLVLVLRRVPRFMFAINFSFLRSRITAALKFLVIEVFQSIDGRIDGVLLSKMQGEAALGLYGAATTLVQMLAFIPDAYYQAVFPSMARSYAHGLKQEVGTLYQHSFRLLFILSIGIAMVITVLGDRIILLVFGPAYKDSVLILQILVWSIVIYSASVLLGTVAIASHNESPYTYFAGIAMVVNIILNLMLIPTWSSMGSSIARLCSMLLLVTLLYRLIANRVSQVDVLRLIVRPVFASIMMTPLLVMLCKLNLAVVLALAGVCYLILLVVLGAFTRDELNIVRRVIATAVTSQVERYSLTLPRNQHRK